MLKRIVFLLIAVFTLQAFLPIDTEAQKRYRKTPTKTHSTSSSKSKTVTVKSYKTKSGKTVQSHKRSAPKRR